MAGSRIVATPAPDTGGRHVTHGVGQVFQFTKDPQVQAGVAKERGPRISRRNDEAGIVDLRGNSCDSCFPPLATPFNRCLLSPRSLLAFLSRAPGLELISLPIGNRLRVVRAFRTRRYPHRPRGRPRFGWPRDRSIFVDTRRAVAGRGCGPGFIEAFVNGPGDNASMAIPPPPTRRPPNGFFFRARVETPITTHNQNRRHSSASTHHADCGWQKSSSSCPELVSRSQHGANVRRRRQRSGALKTVYAIVSLTGNRRRTRTRLRNGGFDVGHPTGSPIE